MALLAQLVMTVFTSICFAIFSIYAVEMVPTHMRFSVVAMGLSLSDSIFAGITPFVSTLLIQKTHSYVSLVMYLVVCALISLFAIYRHWVREKTYTIKEDW